MLEPGTDSVGVPTKEFSAITASRIQEYAPRLLICIASMTTLWVTAALWQPRISPPLLPVLAVPSLNFLPLLLAASLLPVMWPRAGTGIYAGLFVWAVLADQTRLQPQFFSFIILYMATISPGGRLVARVYLITFWFYAGLHKLMSPEFLGQMNPYLLAGLVPHAPEWMKAIFPYAAVLAEAGLGLALLFPRARKIASVHILVLHLLIFISLSPLGQNWNSSVWAWNLLLAPAGFWLFYNWKANLLEDLRGAGRMARAACLVLVLYPAGFYLGVSDPYLSHALYSRNVPQAKRCTAAGECAYLDTTATAINAPLPPRYGAYREFFRRVCGPGDTLKIRESRRIYKDMAGEIALIECPVLP